MVKYENVFMESIFAHTMADMNWKEIEQMGQESVPVLFPLGVVEEHGPHLPLGTDIYMSYAVCRKIKSEIEGMSHKCIIAPPFYWGINHCTKAFPGSFSLKPETMMRVLKDIFEDFKRFGFKNIYCVNQHGDPVHIKTILGAIQEANEANHMHIRMLMEPHELSDYILSGDEPYILVDKAEYSPSLFEGDSDSPDIHAGAYETAAMHYFYKHMVDGDTAKNLPYASMSHSDMHKWFQGGEGVRDIVPLGYVGNPSQYAKKQQSVEGIYSILCRYVAQEIVSHMRKDHG